MCCVKGYDLTASDDDVLIRSSVFVGGCEWKAEEEEEEEVGEE